MQAATPSRTALRVALRRAAHQLVDADPLIFPDPLALPILGPIYSQELQRTPTRVDRPHSHALRAFIVARSRFAEDVLRTYVRAGANQYVLLGAGLDTFSFRNPFPTLRVFEVDHPATQAWKRDLLAQACLAIPPSATLVSVNFERQDVTVELLQAGFDPRQPTLFVSLGVTPYLTLSAFRANLALVASCADGSGMVFDYGQPRHALSSQEQLAHDSLAQRVALAGEPFQLFFTPEEMRRELTEAPTPFTVICDLGRDEINARYFEARKDKLRIMGSAGRLLHASIRSR